MGMFGSIKPEGRWNERGYQDFMSGKPADPPKDEAAAARYWTGYRGARNARARQADARVEAHAVTGDGC